MAKDPEPEKTLEELASDYQAKEALVTEHNNRMHDYQCRIRDSERAKDALLADMNRLKRTMAERLGLLPKTRGVVASRTMSDGELQEIDARMAETTKAIEEQ